MFLKNNVRPAFAGAADFGSVKPSKIKNDAVMLDAGSETDDFGAFNSSPSQPRQGAPRRAPQRQQKSSAFKPSSILIAVAAVVAIILLIVLIVAFVAGSNGNIKYVNNTYTAFSDEDGIYRVAVNGEIIGEYESEVSLIPAADNSFAYIIEAGDDGYRVHIAKGKKVESILSAPVDKVLATASLQPGVVWLETDNGVYFYNEDKGEELITKDYESLISDSLLGGLYNYIFHISADASTVVYAETDADKAPQFNLYIYQDSTSIKSQKNLLPVAVSGDGSLIYGYGISAKDGVTKAFYVLTEDDDKYLIDEGFGKIVAMNIEGNEVVYTTNTESGTSTYIYAFNAKKMDEEAAPTKIGNGVCTPVAIDPETACFATFAETYFQRSDIDYESSTPTYYINKKFENNKVSNFTGKFDTDGKYFFYTNNDNTLQYIDLSDDNYTPTKITEDIVDFEVTQKGNVYWLNDSGRLSFYNISKDKSTRISDDVESISMHSYSNTLYFKADSVNVFITEEGSEKNSAKFDSATVSGLPVFSDSHFKKSFAAFWDSDNEEWRLYHTANGKSFKFITTAVEIDGFDIPFFGDTTPDLPDSGAGSLG